MNPEEKKAIRWAVENTDFRYPISIKTVKEAFLAGYLLAKDEEIAIEFVEWVEHNYSRMYLDNGKWHWIKIGVYTSDEFYTTQQLHALFIEQKNKKG